MSRKSEGLHGNQLGDRWNITHAPSAGATVVASVSAPLITERHILDSLSFSIRNQAAAAHTVTVAIRDVSVAGTVLWSFDTLTAAAASKEVVCDGLMVQGSRGAALHITGDTVLASVKATVNAAGWTDKPLF
jgi:hypothetical protein